MGLKKLQQGREEVFRERLENASVAAAAMAAEAGADQLIFDSEKNLICFPFP